MRPEHPTPGWGTVHPLLRFQSRSESESLRDSLAGAAGRLASLTRIAFDGTWVEYLREVEAYISMKSYDLKTSQVQSESLHLSARFPSQPGGPGRWRVCLGPLDPNIKQPVTVRVDSPQHKRARWAGAQGARPGVERLRPGWGRGAQQESRGRTSHPLRCNL